MAASSRVPRLLRNNEVIKEWAISSCGAASAAWSPRELLTGTSSVFPASSQLTVKRSSTSRFFMYEEQGQAKLNDGIGKTEELLVSPAEMANLLHEKDDSGSYHYWTSPVASVAPELLERFPNYHSLHNDQRFLDPRGPSMWMGNSGSATQAHYDVADNVLVQLHGSKRIRCYPPKAAKALHVFPDSHPRARKSQVNFDEPDHDRYPFFTSLPAPILDVILQPGDALWLPAFWFHHVENGRLPPSSSSTTTTTTTCNDAEDAPSVSVNVFSFSAPMMTAQRIFQTASRPFGFLPPPHPSDQKAVEEHHSFALAVLRALGHELLKGLNREESSPSDYIRSALLTSRYAPLGVDDDSSPIIANNATARALTMDENAVVASCIASILPEFELLDDSSKIQNEGKEEEESGIVDLIALHLLELWAVELVGAGAVAGSWSAALHD
jgi:hypothetical protein